MNNIAEDLRCAQLAYSLTSGEFRFLQGLIWMEAPLLTSIKEPLSKEFEEEYGIVLMQTQH